MNFHSLPKRLWWSHHLAFLTHDFLAQILIEGDKRELFWITLEGFTDDQQLSFNAINDDQIIDWLRGNGCNDESKDLIERMLLRGILGDMVQFLYESIEAAAKGKMGVAFALLRKPFRDQLFLIEWILDDRDSFLNEFSKGPQCVDICQLLSRQRQFMQNTIKSAVSKSNYASLIDHDLMWELRFEKSLDWGLESLWNQALHLVTTNKHYRTEDENLNFIFLQEDDRDELLEQYYRAIPMVLVHICGVVEAIVHKWDHHFVAFGQLFEYRMLANIELWLRETSDKEVDSFGIETLNELLSGLNLTCEDCQEPIRVHTSSHLEDFISDYCVKCKECGCLNYKLGEIDELQAEETDD